VTLEALALGLAGDAGRARRSLVDLELRSFREMAASHPGVLSEIPIRLLGITEVCLTLRLVPERLVWWRLPWIWFRALGGDHAPRWRLASEREPAAVATTVVVREDGCVFTPPREVLDRVA